MKKNESKNFAIGAGLREITERYGSAGAEFLKGLRGIDYESGIKFDRGLLDIENYKINPDYAELNIKQQAGFSAEVAAVSKRNAEGIIQGKPNRFIRSEDLKHYGKNNNTVDIVELIDKKEISTSQMKFVNNPDKLLKKIARGKGGGKDDYSRYMSVDKLEVPTEQVKQMKETCRTEYNKLKNQSKVAREKGNIELANELERDANNYKKLEKKITDSGLTTEEAIAYRLKPRLETAKDIALVSHRAGIEGAKFGAVIGGSISLVTNIIAMYSDDKEFSEALCDTAKDSLKAAGVGYATAFTGSAIKGIMQQSQKEIIRQISKTGLPTMIISTCLSMGDSIKQYAQGNIDESTLLRNIGETTVGSMSTAVFAGLGQIAIPIPVLGGLIGGMIGYTLTTNFYQSFFNVLNEVKASEEYYHFIAMKCLIIKEALDKYKNYLDNLFKEKISQLNNEKNELFNALSDPNISDKEFCQRINSFAEFLGAKLPIKDIKELDDVMLSNEPFTI